MNEVTLILHPAHVFSHWVLMSESTNLAMRKHISRTAVRKYTDNVDKAGITDNILQFSSSIDQSVYMLKTVDNQ